MPVFAISKTPSALQFPRILSCLYVLPQRTCTSHSSSLTPAHGASPGPRYTLPFLISLFFCTELFNSSHEPSLYCYLAPSASSWSLEGPPERGLGRSLAVSTEGDRSPSNRHHGALGWCRSRIAPPMSSLRPARCSLLPTGMRSPVPQPSVWLLSPQS